MQRSTTRRVIWTAVVTAAVIVAAAVGGIYVADYYRADSEAIAALSYTADITVTDIGGATAYIPADATAGLIFYPGGKVEHTAYEPLMMALSERGVLCVLTEMPLRLAVLDMNAADGVRERFPSVSEWYIGGHSLGGSMAASYVARHTDAFEGLVLLAAYSTADLSSTDLRVLSIYGSEDGVLNMDKYEQYKPHLPANHTERIIDGGCHAYFGLYGAQDGDGVPRISPAEQIRITAQTILDTISQ